MRMQLTIDWNSALAIASLSFFIWLSRRSITVGRRSMSKFPSGVFLCSLSSWKQTCYGTFQHCFHPRNGCIASAFRLRWTLHWYCQSGLPVALVEVNLTLVRLKTTRSSVFVQTWPIRPSLETIELFPHWNNLPAFFSWGLIHERIQRSMIV